ncbi:hypothetical protein ABS71_05890 [bacterium SCN 62-11]|nr:VTT domain-containing protein [Candidatus Eremiobacteraeota bacterium]ODT74263.1 MAG: hypothetical protein ABS71_05890 [bacterium SCN 62-11]
MSATLESLKTHGYPLLFATVLLEQLGLPFPAAPVLMAAGALVGLDHLNFFPALLVTVGAAVLGDLAWYGLGRKKGASILKTLCRMAIEPDHCVNSTAERFSKWGANVLVVAKFLPGLSTLAPPMAGMSGVRVARFIALDSIGSGLWALFYGGLGFLLREQLEELIAWVEKAGATILQFGAALLAAHLAFRFARRWFFLRRLRAARISAHELKKMIDGGESPYIADLRQKLQRDADPFTIPGARVVALDALDVIPRDLPVVVYCSCPNEATAANVAMLLQKKGIHQVHPLLGGLDGWREAGFEAVALS